AELTVEPFTLSPEQGPTGDVTHRVLLTGGDQPGIIAHLSEVFVKYGANIVRIEARRVPDAPEDRYETRFAVWLPEDKARVCLATIANTAGELSLDCSWQEA
ncbi:MAG: glycine cleavage system protein R, partial [Alphaproteobacteria bacterium]